MQKCAVVLFLLLCFAQSVVAHTSITTLPFVANIPHMYYVLDGDMQVNFTGTENAIEIDADDITIDLRGHSITNVTNGVPTLAVGFWATGSFKNVTIMNGTFTGFWYAGVGLSEGLRLENIRAADSIYIGIYIATNGAVLQNNYVVNTGVQALLGANHDAYGIVVLGAGNRILNNDVYGVTPTGTGHGRGIAAFLSSGTLVINNRITGVGHSGVEIGTTDKYRDNVVSGAANPYVGGLDIGNNN